MPYLLHCSSCSHTLSPSQPLYVCPRDGARLDITYDLRAVGSMKRERAPGVWKYRALLPATDATPEFSLGEGDTPLLHAARLGKSLGLARLYLKNEALNPSGTFKDRCMAVGVAKAIEFRASALAIASAGNAGAAASTYAAKGAACLIVTLLLGLRYPRLARMD